MRHRKHGLADFADELQVSTGVSCQPAQSDLLTHLSHGWNGSNGLVHALDRRHDQRDIGKVQLAADRLQNLSRDLVRQRLYALQIQPIVVWAREAASELNRERWAQTATAIVAHQLRAVHLLANFRHAAKTKRLSPAAGSQRTCSLRQASFAAGR